MITFMASRNISGFFLINGEKSPVQYCEYIAIEVISSEKHCKRNIVQVGIETDRSVLVLTDIQ